MTQASNGYSVLSLCFVVYLFAGCHGADGGYGECGRNGHRPFGRDRGRRAGCFDRCFDERPTNRNKQRSRTIYLPDRSSRNLQHDHHQGGIPRGKDQQSDCERRNDAHRRRGDGAGHCFSDGGSRCLDLRIAGDECHDWQHCQWRRVGDSAESWPRCQFIRHHATWGEP